MVVGRKTGFLGSFDRQKILDGLEMLVDFGQNLRGCPHVHPGGEEIFVLSGVFEDELGVYPQGTWLRNPSYSQHHPYSRGGCTIFVKTGHI